MDHIWIPWFKTSEEKLNLVQQSINSTSAQNIPARHRVNNPAQWVTAFVAQNYSYILHVIQKFPPSCVQRKAPTPRSHIFETSICLYSAKYAHLQYTISISARLGAWTVNHVSGTAVLASQGIPMIPLSFAEVAFLLPRAHAHLWCQGRNWAKVRAGTHPRAEYAHTHTHASAKEKKENWRREVYS